MALDWRSLPRLEIERMVNERGNTVLNLGLHCCERYFYDFQLCTPEEGWEQYDTSQDAWYFGVWVQTNVRWILTYAEGDLSLVQCATQESFQAELKSMADFYGEAPAAIVAVAPDGSVTRYFSSRPTGEFKRSET